MTSFIMHLNLEYFHKEFYCSFYFKHGINDYNYLNLKEYFAYLLQAMNIHDIIIK